MLLLLLLQCLAFIQIQCSFPTSAVLAKHPSIYQGNFQKAIPTNSFFQQLVHIPNFQASVSQFLKPVYCVSKINQYNFKSIYNIIRWKVVLRDIAITTSVGGVISTKFKVRILYLEGQTSIIFGINYILFGKSLESSFLNGDLGFYSFQYSMNQVYRINSNSAINQAINLPVLFGDSSFALAGVFGDYTFLGYLVGIDGDWDLGCTFKGLGVSLSATSLTALQLVISPNHASCNYPIQLSSLHLSIVIFNRNLMLNKDEISVQNGLFALNFGVKTNSYPFALIGKTVTQDLNLLFGLNSFITQFSQAYAFQFTTSYGTSASSMTTINCEMKDINANVSNKFFTLSANAFAFNRIYCLAGSVFRATANACASTCTSAQYQDNSIIKFSVSTCQKCHFSCAQCLDSISCEACLNNVDWRQDPNGGTQLCIAVPGKYVDLSVANSVSIATCSPPCLECTATATFCTSCNPGNYLQINPSTYDQTCLPCSTPFPNCQSCTYQQCLSCLSGFLLISGSCQTASTYPCNDAKWTKQNNEQCDNFFNGILTGCTNQCEIVDGFQCVEEQPFTMLHTVCYYTNKISLYFKSLSKEQFSNTLKVVFHLTANYWNSPSDLNSILTFTSEDHFLDYIGYEYKYDQTKEELTCLLYFSAMALQSKALTVEVDYMNLKLNQLKNHPVYTETVVLSPEKLTQAYFLINHSSQVYNQAETLSYFYTIASVIGVCLIFVGLLGGKHIVLESLAILQITYLGLLQIQRYSPLYLSATRLFPIGGTVIDVTSSIPNLATLNLSTQFICNFNYHIILFFFFIIAGVVLIMLSKKSEEKSEKAIFMNLAGINCLAQYALYSLLMFSYLASASLGLQIKYQIFNNSSKVNYVSLFLGFLYPIALIVYSVLIFKYAKYFGQFFKEMEKFGINQKFASFLILQKFIVGFLLGLLLQFRFIGFLLAFFELLLVVFVFLKQPFRKSIFNVRMIVNYGYLIFILIIYNVQKLYLSDSFIVDSSPWLYTWPLVAIVLIFALLLKNIFSITAQIIICLERLYNFKRIYFQYEDYYSQKSQSKQKKEDKEDEKPNPYNLNQLQRPNLTPKKLKTWKNMLNIKTGKNQFLQRFERNLHGQTQEQKYEEDVLIPSFKINKQMKRLDKAIQKRMKQLQERQQLQQSVKNQKKQIKQEQNQSQSSKSSHLQNHNHQSISSQSISQSQSQVNDSQERSQEIQSENSSRSLISEILRNSNQDEDQNSEEKRHHNDLVSNLKKIQIFDTYDIPSQKGKTQLYSDNLKQISKIKQNYEKKFQKMTTSQHWDQIQSNGKKLEFIDQIQEQNDGMHEDFYLNKNNDSQILIGKNKFMPIKNANILLKNPLLSYYRNDIQTQIHSNLNPYEEMRHAHMVQELGKQKSKDQMQNIMRQMQAQLQMDLNKNKSPNKNGQKKLTYRGGKKFETLENKLNAKQYDKNRFKYQ